MPDPVSRDDSREQRAVTVSLDGGTMDRLIDLLSECSPHGERGTDAIGLARWDVKWALREVAERG